MIDWEQLRADILKERGAYCENCHMRKWSELHHMLVHRSKRKPELDCKENLMAVCRECHPYLNGYFSRQAFWDSQCKRYGREHMQAWLDALPLKVKPRF
jgi:hypothetical protein